MIILERSFLIVCGGGGSVLRICFYEDESVEGELGGRGIIEFESWIVFWGW